MKRIIKKYQGKDKMDNIGENYEDDNSNENSKNSDIDDNKIDEQMNIKNINENNIINEDNKFKDVDNKNNINDNNIDMEKYFYLTLGMFAVLLLFFNGEIFLIIFLMI